MKKSKILIPAFAVLALSVGASVSGTVAWFTASRSQSFSSTFAVKDINGDLGITLKGNKNAGTSLVSDKIVVDGNLTHGSFDATNKKDAPAKLYVASLSNNPNAGENDPKFIVDRYNDLGTIPNQPTNTEDANINSKWLAGTDKENKHIWYGVAWEATVTLGETAISGTNHLFLDFNTSKASDATKANAGFRLAIMGNTGDDAIVLGNKAEQANHVTGEDKTSNKGTFKKWHQFGSTVAKAMDEQTIAEFKDNGGYIGEFATPVDGESEINLKFVAWFEGEDVDVVSNNTVTTAVAATLSFYARRTTKI